jgi:dTDP-glucose pyrophosphorylase
MRESPLAVTATLMDAVHSIEISPRRLAVVVGPNDNLIGTITDGDIRRHLLKGGSLGDCVIHAMNTDPVAVFADTSETMIHDLMRINNIVVVPVIDENKKYLDLIHLFDSVEVSDYLEYTNETYAYAVIMAGGEGSRLRPLTADTPKPMIMIGDFPLLEHQIRNLAKLGVTRVFISINYLGDIIQDYFGNGDKFGIEIDYLREEFKGGTAGALSLLSESPDRPILVLNGDIFTASDFNALYTFHKSINAQITIATIDYRFDIPYGVIKLSGEFVSEIIEKPSERFMCSAGIYAISPEILKMIPKAVQFNMTELINSCLEIGTKISAFPIHEYWTDIGTYADLEKARSRFKQEELPTEKD